MSPATHHHAGDHAPLVWSDAYSVGDPQLDADHKQLFALAGTLGDDGVPLAPGVVADVLDALSTYVIGHFEREEHHQEAMGFPDLAPHRAHHTRLVERLNAFRARYISDPQQVDADALRDFLHQWLVHHVLEEDMKYHRYAVTHTPSA